MNNLLTKLSELAINGLEMSEENIGKYDETRDLHHYHIAQTQALISIAASLRQLAEMEYWKQ